MNSKILVGLIVVVVVIGGVVLWAGKSSAPISEDINNSSGTVSQDQPAAANPSGSSTTGNTVSGEKKFTMTEVSVHDSRTSCYSVIRGSVYDLTTWIDKHPGGAGKILELCGKDGTDKFVDQHGGKQQQEDALASFKIGIISN